MKEPINMLNPAHLNRAARGMHGRLLACMPDGTEIKIVDNVMQFIHHGATIQIIADAYWKYSNVVCWFVTSTSGEDLTMLVHASDGTVNTDECLLNIGRAMQYAEERS